MSTPIIDQAARVFVDPTAGHDTTSAAIGGGLKHLPIRYRLRS